jgi:LacI family transcriptional regulator
MTAKHAIQPHGPTRNVALACTAPAAARANIAGQALQGAIIWGKKRGWNLVDLGHWNNRVPEGIRFDGLISHISYDDWPLARKLHAQFPVSVGIDCETLNRICPNICLNPESVAEQAASYYLERGFKNFAIAAYRGGRIDQSLRLFQKRVRQAGCSWGYIRGLNLFESSIEEAHAKFREQFKSFDLPLAIFCINDRLAGRVCNWVLEEGIAVPEQVAILGVGDDPIACECSPVALSSITSQPIEQGIQAAKLLERMMNGEKVPPGPALVPSGGVTTRRSTDITAISNLSVARALRFIWDEYNNNIHADDVAEACDMPRRSLDRHFKQELGHSVTSEITYRRLLKARNLLVTTTLSVTDIAAKVGFQTPQYFNLQFKKHYRMPPNQWREKERTINTPSSRG